MLDLIDLTSALTFALILPIFQLVIFAFIVYHGIKFYHSLSFTVMSVLEELSDAIIEERTTYNRVKDLLDRIEKKEGIWQEVQITRTSIQE